MTRAVWSHKAREAFLSRITTPFGFHSTAEEVTQGIDLSGKRVVITGGGSGIGIETARVLASSGAEVTIAVCNVEMGESIAAQIRIKTANQQIVVAPLELTDRASSAAFVTSWGNKPLHILINNAGIMALLELQRTVEG